MWTAQSRAFVGDFGAGQALSDEQYALLVPLIPPAKPGGRPRTTDMRRLLDGLFYLVRTGCQWRHLPPPPAFPADSRAKRNGSSEADLHVFAKLREQGLERGEEAEALPRREIVAEDDLLQLGVAHGVQVEVAGQVAA
jgi:transposase